MQIGPLQEMPFITENKNCMFDNGGVKHCLLALEQGGLDGVLIQSTGPDYPYYAAYISGMRDILNAELDRAAAFIVRQCMENSGEGNWCVSFNGRPGSAHGYVACRELEERFGLVIRDGNGLDALLMDALRRQPGVIGRVQAQTAVELSRLWEEQHHKQKKDTASVKKNLARLREAHQRLSQQISGLYESFTLGEIGKPEYLAAKASAVKQRDNTAARISELEAALENLGTDGSLQNGFVSTFGKYLDVKEITSEITAEVLKEVLVYPGNRFEIIWNCREELKNLILDLQ